MMSANNRRDALSGTDRLTQFNEVVVENRQMLDSFAVVSSELRTLSQNLQNAEDLRERLRAEKLEADKKLQAAKIEIAAAEAAKAEAENARRLAEQLAAETLDKAAAEARRLKEKELEVRKIASPPSHSVSAQTETVVEETVTSAVTTKEIHILQKVRIKKVKTTHLDYRSCDRELAMCAVFIDGNREKRPGRSEGSQSTEEARVRGGDARRAARSRSHGYQHGQS